MDQRVRYEWLDGWFQLEKDRWQDCAAAAAAAAAAPAAATAAATAAASAIAAAAVRCTSTRPCRTSSSAALACPPDILDKQIPVKN